MFQVTSLCSCYPHRRPCRHLTHQGSLVRPEKLPYFQRLLDNFPNLTSIALIGARGGIPWAILRHCFSRPSIISLSFDPESQLSHEVSTPDNEESISPITLTHFSCNISLWRELAVGSHVVRTDMRLRWDREATCLEAIVPHMNQTAIHLTLPLETAPLRSMASRPWPRLRELC